VDFATGNLAASVLSNLLAEVLDIQIGRGRCSLAAALGRGAMPWSAESAIQILASPTWWPRKLKSRQLLVGSESHRLHFR